MRRRMLAVLGLIAALLVIWAQAAQAYVIFGSWPGASAGLNPAPSLPSSFYNGQGFAAAQWTGVTTSNWTFVKQPGSQNDLTYGGIDGSLGILAVTTVHFNGQGDISEADVKYDSAENWYTGSGTPGSNQVDLRSVATHEFGHITGLDHTQNSHCPGNSTDATMCLTYTLGSTYIRSLATDDKDGLTANYPQRPRSDLAGKAAVFALYPRLSEQELVALASTAFVGRVESVSAARWNADDGRIWAPTEGRAGPLAFHQLRFRVDRWLRGGQGSTVTVTVFGASPSGSVDGSVAGRPDHGLVVGDQVLVLAARGALPWRDGSVHSVLRFAGAPLSSYAWPGSAAAARFRALLG